MLGFFLRCGQLLLPTFAGLGRSGLAAARTGCLPHTLPLTAPPEPAAAQPPRGHREGARERAGAPRRHNTGVGLHGDAASPVGRSVGRYARALLGYASGRDVCSIWPAADAAVWHAATRRAGPAVFRSAAFALAEQHPPSKHSRIAPSNGCHLGLGGGPLVSQDGRLRVSEFRTPVSSPRLGAVELYALTVRP